MKRYQRFVFLGLVVSVISTCLTVTAQTTNNQKKETEMSVSVSKNTYMQYLQNIAEQIRTENGIVWDIADTIDAEGIQTTISVPKDGVYTVGLAYSSINHDKSTIALRVKIDGANILENNQSIQLNKLYQDIDGVRMDGLGNEFAPEQGDYDQSAFIYPVDSENLNTYQISLTKGEHIIEIASLNDELHVLNLVLKADSEVKQYEAPTDETLYYDGEAIVQEGEDSLWKNSSWLVSQADNGSCQVTPADPVINRINYIGGSNWKKTGDTITWGIEVPKDGYYQLGFSYRQSLIVNYSSYRRLLIDGESPFAEMEAIEFPYNLSWEKMIASDENKNPYLFYLTKGFHTISLQVTLGEYEEICQRMEVVVEELGNLNLKMTMITGETVDISRDYDLFKYIPDLEERLTACVKEMTALEEAIIGIAGGESSSYALVLRNMTRVAKQMLNHQYSAARYKSDFYTNYSSLSVCLSDMKEMPLDIDQLILGKKGDETFKMQGGITGFFQKVGFSVKRFWNSFFKDYNSVSGSTETKEKLVLWVNWGQDQARVLNSMIQTDFTTEYGIEVEVQVTNATIVQALISGNGPDMVLQMARTEPVNLAMRGAIYDLTNFEDYEEVLKRFADGAETPYCYEGGTYALPDTQVYNVLFYRKDILAEMGLSVPTTWEEFNEVSKTLLHNNLSVSLPYTQITSNTTVNTGVGGLTLYPTLLLQNEVDLYAKDGSKSNLTSAEALNVFEEWMDYYTKMKLPTTMDFYNRFRAGTCPLGIATYSTAVTLTTEAPELDGLWGMSIVPGIVSENGSVNHAIAGAGTGCSILNASENKDAAWTFLKWWTSAEIQAAYSTNLESILGPLGRVMVSNTEALQSLSWTEEQLTAILNAREYLQEIPEVPGGYQVSRSIDMSFYDVVNTNVNAKDTLTKWGKIADNEIQRKWKSYANKLIENEE